MDRRFRQVWEDMDARRRAGEPLSAMLRKAPTRDVIAALAGVGDQDPVAANVIATELLNRQARAPFFGAFLVCIGIAIATFVVDTILTGGPIHVLSESSARGYVMAGLSASVGVVALLMYVSWRGHLRWTRALLARVQARRRGGGRDSF
jgi:hypothetical protein